MGMLFDYFMGPTDEAALTWPDGDGCDDWPVLSLGQADPNEFLAPLYDLLRGGDGKGFDEDDFSLPLREPQDDVEEWLLKIPADFVDRLLARRLSPEDEVIVTWGDLYAGMDADDAIDLLSEFVELASEGKRLGYSMYCWVSL
jgi:hypothetical protein